MSRSLEVQGHRGARGLRPENTLPSFEAALDCGVTSIETDVLRTRDGALVLYHDRTLSPSICRTVGPASVGIGQAISALSLEQLHRWIADGNPDPLRFASQSSAILPLSAWFADQRGLHPYVIPTLNDLIAFIDAYAGDGGAALGKTEEQRANAAQVILDLELKRAPFMESEGEARATEEALLGVIGDAGRTRRCRVRSFDHRTVRRLVMAEPRLVGGVLVARTAPIRPTALALDAGAKVYCPDYQYLDAQQVRDAQSAGLRVLPWTANEPHEWARLLEWGADGITTDYPDWLVQFLQAAATL